MKLLIGITTRNRCKILSKAIDAALAQSYEEKEVWVFDDASTDETSELKSNYPQLTWISSSTPKGLVYARNMFMSQPGFDLFCSLDDDAWLLDEHAIDKAVTIFKTQSEIGAIGFDMLSPDRPNTSGNRPEIELTNTFYGCGHIIRLTAAKQINYYTLNPGYYGSEEKDFCIRLIDQEYDVVKYKYLYVWHDKTTLSRDLHQQHRSGVCNDLVFCYRRTPLFFLLPGLCVKMMKHVLYSIKTGQQLFMPCLYGVWDFLKWAILQRTFRAPVSIRGFNKFRRLA